MKRTLGLSAIALAVAVTSGCTTIARNHHATDTAALNAKALTIQNRPVEMGMEQSGESNGEANLYTILGFKVSGDKVRVSLPVIGNMTGDPLKDVAAYKATRANNSDAFYIIRSEEDKFGLGFLFEKRSVKVWGKTYKVKDLGLMSADRADKLNTAPAGSAASGGKRGGIFGIFGL